MMKLKAKALRPGATIGVVAPASPVTPERIEYGLQWLRDHGYRIVTGQHLFAQHGYLAGTDQERASDLLEMFARPEVEAIFCARGGYGTPRLLSLLDYDLIREK